MAFSLRQSKRSTIDPAAAALIAGAVHHFLVQYPNQAKLFTTLYSFAVTNIAFIVLLLGPEDALRRLGLVGVFVSLVSFNFVYV